MLSPARARLAFLALPVLLLCACRGFGGASSQLPSVGMNAGESPLAQTPRLFAKSKIQHIVIVIQENRSFNNLFYGYPGAKTATFGYAFKNQKNQKIALKPVVLETKWDLQHSAVGFLLSCNGAGGIPGTKCRMNGFDKQRWNCGQSGFPPCPNKNPPYSYVPHDEIKPYFDMAKQYVLADEMFASDWDTSSFISHQYMIAGVNPNHSINYPETVWGCPGGPNDKIDLLFKNRRISPHPVITACWNPKTLADELDNAGIPWAYYAAPVSGGGGSGKDCGSAMAPNGKGSGGTGIWSAYQAIKDICHGPDWNKDVISPPSQFLSDVSSGNLRAVSWVTPTYANSDHGGSGSKTGPSWIASIVNAVGKSKYWNSSAIFIFWDDSGGWYDPVKPPYVDNDGFGFRLPLLIVSPYAKKGHVSHVQYEHGSILKFLEDQFGLGRLAASDSRANSPAKDCFDFSRPPRKFVPFKAPYDESFFRSQSPDLQPPDDE